MDEATAMLVVGTVAAAFPGRKWPDETIELWVRALQTEVPTMAVVDAAAGDLEEHHELEVPHARFERAALALVLEPNEHPPALGQLVHAMKRARREFIDAAQDRLEARLIERYEQIAVPPPAPLRELIAGATHPMPE